MANSVSVECPLLGCRLSNSYCTSHDGGRVRELSGVSFIRAPIPFMRAPPSWPKCLTKAPPPNTITLGGLDLKHTILGRGHKYSVHHRLSSLAIHIYGHCITPVVLFALCISLKIGLNSPPQITQFEWVIYSLLVCWLIHSFSWDTGVARLKRPWCLWLQYINLPWICNPPLNCDSEEI